jgi:alkanesulfonate monooxygenase SsuD/methylene tetrahydromethanopterin reductase-like flavin-dependent oxidoreductase (luciferase family)
MVTPKFVSRSFNFIPQASGLKPRPSLEVYRENAVRAEELGYDGFSYYDHNAFYRNHENIESFWRELLHYDALIMTKDILELWTTLTYLATVTSRIKVVANVVCINFRAPSTVAHAGATLDVICNGRLELGLGTGGDIDEAQAFGLPNPGKPSVRAERLREYVQIIKMMWTEEAASFEGKYYGIKGAVCNPKPLQKPHPPINIAGRYRGTLRVVAEHADIYTPNDVFGTLSALRILKQRHDVLREECEKVGRDYGDIEKAVMFQLLLANDKTELDREISNWLPPGVTRKEYEAGVVCCTPEECTHVIGEYLDAGISYFLMDFMDAPRMKGIRIFSEQVMKNFR